MVMGPHFNMIRFGAEIGYTLIIVLLCFLVYSRTKEMYDLTKHKGIRYFREAFFLFGITYVSRFIFYLFQMSTISIDFHRSRYMAFPIAITFVGYLSTMAISYLAYSKVWKRIKFSHFFIVSNCMAILVAIVSFVMRSPPLISLAQLPLVVFIILVSVKSMSKGKSTINALYLLISLFWLFNMIALGPRWLLPFEIKILLQIISIGVFLMLVFKVSRWTK